MDTQAYISKITVDYTIFMHVTLKYVGYRQ